MPGTVVCTGKMEVSSRADSDSKVTKTSGSRGGEQDRTSRCEVLG